MLEMPVLPTLITAMPPDSFASRSCSFSLRTTGTGNAWSAGHCQDGAAMRRK